MNVAKLIAHRGTDEFPRRPPFHFRSTTVAKEASSWISSLSWF
jgi:hypothetical protein